MICKLCGKELPEGAAYCDGCGASLAPEEPSRPEPPAVEEAAGEPADGTEFEPRQAEPASEPTSMDWVVPAEAAPAAEETSAPPRIRSHMVAAIVTVVLLSNWILGIPAIIFARECELAAEKGQWDIAERFSRRAANFTWIGVALNLAIGAFLALFLIVVRAAAPALIPYFIPYY